MKAMTDSMTQRNRMTHAARVGRIDTDDRATDPRDHHQEDHAVTLRRDSYTISYYPNRIVLQGARHDIREEASRILGKFSYSAQPYEIQSETPDSIVIVPCATSVHL